MTRWDGHEVMPARRGVQWPCSGDCHIGVALVGPEEDADLVGVDEDGVIWRLASGERMALTRFGLYRQLIVWPTLPLLVFAMLEGRCTGLLFGIAQQVAVEWDGGSRWFRPVEGDDDDDDDEEAADQLGEAEAGDAWFEDEAADQGRRGDTRRLS